VAALTGTLTLGLLSCGLLAANAYAGVTSTSPTCFGGGDATVHFLISPPSGSIGPAISGLTVSGLSADCDRSPVTVTLLGNPAGDPYVDPTETLSVFDSTLDPCSQVALANPPVVSGGSITLTACASGGPAAYASIHDVTRLVVKVNGRVVDTSLGYSQAPSPSPSTTSSPSVSPEAGGGVEPSVQPSQSGGTDVLGEKVTRHGPTIGAQRGSGLSLPFTGGWWASLSWLGAIVLFVGSLIIALVRRRPAE
jgi:hypothetical protein